MEQFYNNFPNIESFKDQIERKKISFSKEHRNILVNVLREQYHEVDVSEEVKNQLELIGKENTFTITTGHQLCLFTGPIFFIIKILQAIKICKDLENKFSDYNFVPIFWMATEDHDFEEIKCFNTSKKEFSIEKNSKVIVIDDLLATGGTAAAAGKLIKESGGNLIGYAFLIELTELQGRNKLETNLFLESLIKY